jgi:hypothetical protein
MKYDYDEAINRLIELKLTNVDLKLFQKAGSDPLSLTELDRLAELARNSELQPSALALEAQRIGEALIGTADHAATTAPTEQPPEQPPEQPTGNLQQLSQGQLWELAAKPSAQMRR